MKRKLVGFQHLGSFPISRPNEEFKAYFVTSLREPKNPGVCDVVEERRCWGYFLDLKRAKQSVKHNECDMFETFFTHVVVEAISPGICNYDEKPIWYKIIPPKSKEKYRPKWKRCKQPKWADRIVGWSLG